MKIILIGSNGTIGSAIAQKLKKAGHSLLEVNLTSGNVHLDISSENAIQKFYEKAGPFDGLICAAGSACTGPLDSLEEKDFYNSIKSKLMGQVNLVIKGNHFINPGGFFTLTSGILAEEPNYNKSALGLVNGALNGFVINAALEMPNKVRINIVSPSILLESIPEQGQCPGRSPIEADHVALHYLRTVNEKINGEVLRAFGKPDVNTEKIMMTIFLKHQQDKNLKDIRDVLDGSSFKKLFPIADSKIVSWYVMMGIGQVVTVQIPAHKLQELNLAIEKGAWGAFNTEFYATYDYMPVYEDGRLNK